MFQETVPKSQNSVDLLQIDFEETALEELSDLLKRVSSALAEKLFPENPLPEKHFPERSISRIYIIC